MKERQPTEEEDDEIRAEDCEVEDVSDGTDASIDDLEKRLMTLSAKYKERESSPLPIGVETTTMTQEQVNLVYDLAQQRLPFKAIEDMMGVSEGAVDASELDRVMMEAKWDIAREEAAHREADSQNGSESEGEYEDKDFEAYDPVQWETATEVEDVDKAQDEEKCPTLVPLRVPQDFEKENRDKAQPCSPQEQVFVRALKHSKMNTKPYFRKGDILRVINKAQRRDPDNPFFELLPLKPPGEAGQALIKDFESADEEAVDQVGREAKTEKEIDSFQCAVNWVD